MKSGNVKSLFFAVLISFTLVSCASTTTHSADAHRFHRYQACVERVVGGRVLHDPGWVVAERDAETGTHFFQFLSTYWGKIIEVTRVNRFCNALRGRHDIGVDSPSASSMIGKP